MEQQFKGATAKFQKEILQLKLEVQDKGVIIFNHIDTIALLRNEREGIDAVHNEFREIYMEKVKKHKGRCADANLKI